MTEPTDAESRAAVAKYFAAAGVLLTDEQTAELNPANYVTGGVVDRQAVWSAAISNRFQSGSTSARTRALTERLASFTRPEGNDAA